MTSDEMLDRADQKSECAVTIVWLASILALVLHELKLSIGWLVALPLLAVLAKAIWYAWYTRRGGAWAKKSHEEWRESQEIIQRNSWVDDDWERNRRERRDQLAREQRSPSGIDETFG